MNNNVNNNNNNNNNSNVNATKKVSYDLATVGGENIVYDLNGKATAPLTLSNAFSALKALERTSKKIDYSRTAIMTAIIESCGDDAKAIAKTKKLLATDYGFTSTGAIDKLYRVATTFLHVDKTALLSAKATDNTALADTVDKDGKKYEIAVNTNCITGLVDKYDFEFSISQLQEMLWLKHDLIEVGVDENGVMRYKKNDDIAYPFEKLTKLIEDGKIKASMSASGKGGIRDVIKENNPPEIDNNGYVITDSNNDSNGNGNGNSNGNSDNETTKTIQYDETSDKTKAVAIQTVINSIKDEKFTKNKAVAPFIEYLAEYIKNAK